MCLFIFIYFEYQLIMNYESSIKEFIKLLNNEIDSINSIINKRTRKLQFKDLLYFLSFKNGNSLSFDLANAHFKCDNITNVTKTSILNKRKIVGHSNIINLNNNLINYIYKDNKPRYLAVDGSQINMVKNLKDSFEMNKHKTYCNGLLSSLYDVDKKIPINYSLYKSFDEREALKDQLKYVKTNDVLIFDRGYYSDDLLFFFYLRLMS